MNVGMKYIIIDDGLVDTPILFPQWVKHDKMLFDRSVKLLSAGFVQIVGSTVEAYGESVSLKVSSRKEDSEIIQRALNWNS